MALHTYTPYEWKNAPDHKTTPLSADNLNHIEQGIKNAEDDVVEVDTNRKADLTSISQTGSTASQAISAGTYFYLEGTLVKAKVDIANGATFTENTNYEVTTVGDAIKKDSVTVQADGTKTHAQALNELFALLDMSKVSGKSVIRRGEQYYTIHQIQTTIIVAAFTLINSSNTYSTFMLTIQSSGSKFERTVNGTYTDLSTNVLSRDLEFIY
jgi:hypothetical protein